MFSFNDPTLNLCLIITLILCALGLLYLIYYTADHLIFVNININHNERFPNSKIVPSSFFGGS